VWSVRKKGREDRLPFWESGLEELLVFALKLPRPGEHAVARQQPSLDEAVPDPKRSL
jgi:hypothetical protein